MARVICGWCGKVLLEGKEAEPYYPRALCSKCKRKIDSDLAEMSSVKVEKAEIKGKKK